MILKKIKIKKNKILLLLLLLLLYLFFSINEILNLVGKEVSVIINMKNLTEEKHFLFYKLMKELKSSRNYYFIKTLGMPLIENLTKIVENSTVKIIQSNFPDSIFLPFVVSLFGTEIPELVLFIEGNDITDFSGMKRWFIYSYLFIIFFNYDYIFGNSQIIEGQKIGCSLLLSKASIIQHLLFYTDSDTTHANPFIQLSLADETKFCFIELSSNK